VAWDERGRIVYAGRASEAAAGGEEVRGTLAGALDASGCTVLPGLIDTHVHLTIAAAPGPPAPNDELLGPRRSGPAMTAAQVSVLRNDTDGERMGRALAAAQAALSVGVTTLCDLGAKGTTLYELRDLVEAGVVAGPRVLTSGAPITTRAGHCWWMGGEADTADEAVAQVRERVKAGADLIKVMATGGNLTKGSNPLMAQYPVETLAAVVADAHRLGKRVAAHAHGVEGIARAVEAGVDAIEHCTWQRAVGQEIDQRVAERMVAQGTVVGHTLAGAGAVLLRGGTAPEEVPAALQARYGRERTLRELGVRVVTNSDAMYPNRPFEDFALGVASAAVYGGLSPERAVHSATGLAAEALGLGGETGTLAVGKRADVLVVRGNVAEKPAAMGETRWVLRDGRVVGMDGGLVSAGVSGWRWPA
jgi:imidazolonepropionase-like amidohydrolase